MGRPRNSDNGDLGFEISEIPSATRSKKEEKRKRKHWEEDDDLDDASYDNWDSDERSYY